MDNSSSDRFIGRTTPNSPRVFQRRLLQAPASVGAIQTRYHRRIAHALQAMSPTVSSYAMRHSSSISSEEDVSTAAAPREAFRVLHEPGLEDDFYLNPLHWSPSYGQQRSFVGVAAARDTVKVFMAGDSGLVPCRELGLPFRKLAAVQWNPADPSIAVSTKTGHLLYNRQERLAHDNGMRVGVLRWVDANVLASGSKDASVRLTDWRCRGAGSLVVPQAHLQEVCGLAWDGQHCMASGGNDNAVHVWDTRQMHVPVASMLGHQAAVKALAWSPHTRGLLASGGGTADKTIRLWNTLTGQQSTTPTTSQVCALHWSPHANELVTSHGFSDNHLLVWQRKEGLSLRQLGMPFTGHSQRVLFMTGSCWPGVVVTGSGDGSIRFWRVFAEDSGVRSGGRPRLQAPLL